MTDGSYWYKYTHELLNVVQGGLRPAPSAVPVSALIRTALVLARAASNATSSRLI